MDEFKLFGGEKFKSIPKEETTELLKQGTKTAQDKVFEGNLTLVAYVLKKEFAMFENKEDLFQEGCIGLLKAIKNFDLQKGVEFSTYAVSKISGEIKRYIRDTQDLVHKTRSKKDLLRRIRSLEEEYSKNNYGYKLSADEISKMLDVPLKEIEDTIISGQNYVNIDEKVSSEYENITLKDMLYDSSDNIYNSVEYEESISEIKEAFENLSDRDKKMINYYYAKKKVQTQIANELGTSQAQVSRILAKFEKMVKEKLGFQDSYSKNIKEEKIKSESTIMTIYDKLSIYKPHIIDEELEKLEIKTKECLLRLYPKDLKDYDKTLTYNEKNHAKYTLKTLTYNLALRKVKNTDDDSNIAKGDELKMEERNILQKENEKFFKYFENKTQQEVLEALESLDKDSKLILELRFGLNDKPIMKIKKYQKS